MATNHIDQRLAQKSQKSLRLMTHLIAGYPTTKMNLQCASLMEKTGVDFLEVQIPFSDPLADGPTIMRANHRALAAGMTPAKSFDLIRTLTQTTSLPVIIMTYYNIPYKFGIRAFLDAACTAGASGIILPDIPYDASEEDYLDIIKEYPIHPIFVVSPHISETRLKAIANLAKGFVYTTLRIGITGSKSTLHQAGLNQFTYLKQTLTIPIAAGFGISSPEQLTPLKHNADIAVIGSKLLDIIETNGSTGLQALETFLKSCEQTLLKS